MTNRFPKHWDELAFLEAVSDVTAGSPKLQKQDYLTDGKYQVIDQGQATVGGYTDNPDLLAKVEAPTIIFGDHTRIFKYIEHPFCLGADGTKILEPKANLDRRFLFYYLSSLHIESAGYSRHFKFLKEKTVPVPPLEEQKRIAAILDKADTIRKKRQQAIQLADEFLRSVFLDMFGEPNSSKCIAERLSMTQVFDVCTGKLNSNAAVNGGKYPFFTCAKEVFEIDSYAFDQEALLLAGNNAQADYDVKYFKGKFNAYQRTYVLTLKDKGWNYPFFKYALEYQLSNLKRFSKGSNTKYITMEIMNRVLLPVPSKEEQKQFLGFYYINQKIREGLLRHAQNDEILFSSLSQKAFSGKL